MMFVSHVLSGWLNNLNNTSKEQVSPAFTGDTCFFTGNVLLLYRMLKIFVQIINKKNVFCCTFVAQSVV